VAERHSVFEGDCGIEVYLIMTGVEVAFVFEASQAQRSIQGCIG
jgi:hypothetical protein